MQEKITNSDELNINDIPIILVHKGNQEYLKICIKYATEHNHRLVLIGDETNKGLISKSTIWVDYKDLISEKMTEFDNVYQHMNSNPYEYEKFCFDRHFLIYEYIKRNQIKKFFMMDSDVLLGNISNCESEFSKSLSEHDVGLCWIENQGDMKWSASPHFSYWTDKSLENFTNYLLEVYRSDMESLLKKMEWHKNNNISGGICDMTLLYLWSNSESIRALNFCSKEKMNWGINNQLVCKNSERYETKNQIIKIQFDNLSPCFIRKDNNEQVEAFVIHAQGSAKRYMKMLSKGRFSWLEKKLIDLKYFIQNKLKR